MITIEEEHVAHLIESELWPLLQEHREELTTNKVLMELAPLTEQYTAAERGGMMFTLVAREHGRIVGYSGNFIGPHLHYSRLRYSHNDVLFLAKSHRQGPLGLRLIAATEKAAKAHGSQLHVWHAKPDTSLAKILPAKGYRVQDVMFSKEL